MDLKVFEFLGKEVPSSVGDIREALDLLATSIDTAVEQVGERVSKSFADKDFKKAAELSLNSEELDSISKRIQEVISDLDTIIDNRNIEEDSKEIDEVDEKTIPNYSDYLVDTEVEHNLYEDLTHKRPCAFKIEGTKVEIIKREMKATFEMDGKHELQYYEEKGYCTMSYESVIGRGKIRILPENEKMEALKKLMAQYHKDKEAYFNPAAIPRTLVYSLEVEEITAKRK